MTKQARYSQEFKREAVAMASQPGGSCVPMEIGVNPNLLTGIYQMKRASTIKPEALSRKNRNRSFENRLNGTGLGQR